MKNIYRAVLGIERENSGTFEHSFGFAKNMARLGFPINYYSHWFGGPVKELDLDTEKSVEVPESSFGREGIFYLQSHTWEHDGLLNQLNKSNSKTVLNLHAVIPYFYLPASLKSSFLNGTLPKKEIMRVIDEVMSERERSQLNLIDRADYVITISGGHKRALERLGFEKKVRVFENVSDISGLDESIVVEAGKRAINYRDWIDSENVILYCGRLGLGKGSEDLLEAFERISGSYSSAKLVLLGTGESGKQKLIDKGVSSRVLENMVFVPWIDKGGFEGQTEFLKNYFASDVLVQPMITEGLYSKTVIDAMDLGIPTITCKSDYTVGSSESADAIVSSFEKFKSQPGEVKEIVSKAKEKVKRENTWDFYISQLEDFIKE